MCGRHLGLERFSTQALMMRPAGVLPTCMECSGEEAHELAGTPLVAGPTPEKGWQDAWAAVARRPRDQWMRELAGKAEQGVFLTRDEMAYLLARAGAADEVAKAGSWAVKAWPSPSADTPPAFDPLKYSKLVVALYWAIVRFETLARMTSADRPAGVVVPEDGEKVRGPATGRGTA